MVVSDSKTYRLCKIEQSVVVRRTDEEIPVLSQGKQLASLDGTLTTLVGYDRPLSFSVPL